MVESIACFVLKCPDLAVHTQPNGPTQVSRDAVTIGVGDSAMLVDIYREKRNNPIGGKFRVRVYIKQKLFYVIDEVVLGKKVLKLSVDNTWMIDR